MTNQLKSVHVLRGTIEAMTGLHIGAGNDIIEIGGLDNPVIKDRNEVPYIPGSSIKGKLRSILEWKLEGKVKSDKPHSCDADFEKCPICRIFGAHMKTDVKLGPPRILVRDATMSKESIGLNMTEAKYENTIERITGTAGNPRQLERVAVGAKFDFEIVYRNFMADERSAAEDRELLKEAIKLLEHDYLGGSGSRGSGKVRFAFTDWENVPLR